MITESTIYWITRLDPIREAMLYPAVLLSILGSIGAVLITIACISHQSDQEKKPPDIRDKWRWKDTLILCLIYLIPLLGFTLAFGRVFIPTTKEMCAIKIIPAIAQNEEVQEMPDKLVGLANDWIDELRPKKGDSK